MSYRQIFIFVISILFSGATISAAPPSTPAKSRKEVLIDSLNSELSRVRSPQDSIPLIYDLYDLHSSKKPITDLIQRLFYIGRRIDDERIQMDAARRFAGGGGYNDTIFELVKAQVAQLPKSKERDETILFMDVQRDIWKVSEMPMDKRLEEIAKLVASDNLYTRSSRTGDKYNEIRNLYKLVNYMADDFNNTLLPNYLDRLGALIENIDLVALKNQYYNRAATIYTDNGQPEKAVAAFRKLLEALNVLETEDDAIGGERRFRNYDPYRYNYYSRMLANLKAIKPADIEFIQADLLRMFAKNPAQEKRYDHDHRMRANLFMAMQQYKLAVPEIKAELAKDNITLSRRLRLLKALQKAARETDDQTLLVHAMDEYNTQMEAYNKENAAQKYRELQIRYDVHQLQSEKDSLEREQEQNELRTSRRIIWGAIAALIVMAMFLFVVVRLYRKSQRLSIRLSNVVARLQEESEQLHRTTEQLTLERNRAEAANKSKDEFLHSMSHELRTPLNAISGFSKQIVRKLTDEQRVKFDKYVHLITLNTEQLEKIIDDVLYVSSIQDAAVDPFIEQVSVEQVLYECEIGMQGKLASGVELRIVNKTPAGFTFETDRRLLDRILFNLLGNSAKFTEQGYVELMAEIDYEKTGGVIFSVTDTGPGIPPDRAKDVFKRFTKVDTFKPGAGLGLYIAKRTATLINARLRLDTTHSPGTRFTLLV